MNKKSMSLKSMGSLYAGVFQDAPYKAVITYFSKELQMASASRTLLLTVTPVMNSAC